MKVNISIDNLPHGKKGELIFPSNKGDAGYDLVAHSHPRICGDCYKANFFKSIQYIEYDTNIIISPETDEYGDYDIFSLLYPRSSISKYNLSLCNSIGVIDSGYRDTIKIRFNYIHQPENYIVIENKHLLLSVDSSRIYQKGDKVAQLIFAKHIHPKISFVKNVDKTQRGTGGFGSTGK